ncbi:MAG TPA: PaaI family thioesterase [Usitatibacter sp.]|nr:PaaI family thioesterase [Usitatibacter sp.]
MNAKETIERWLAEEEAVRARLDGRTGVSHPEEVEDRTGLEMLSAMLAGELPRAPMSLTLDFLLIRIEPGFAVFQGRPRLEHYNPLGTVHGGWFATLLDSAMGCAVQSTLAAGKGYTTMEFKVNLVRPLTDAVEVVRAEGRSLHTGRQVATAEARLVGPDGKLYAHGTTTCLVFDRR